MLPSYCHDFPVITLIEKSQNPSLTLFRSCTKFGVYMINIHSLSVAEMREALAIKEEIEALQSKLDAILGAEAPPVEAPARGPGRPRKRHMSPAARARIGAAQRARWAKAKRGRKASAGDGAPVEKRKRKVSAAARARLSAAAKARWANAKAEGKSTL
jgi:hypothetical protein